MISMTPAELAACDDLPALLATAAAIRDAAHGPLVSYSRKVFIPLTQLCRDTCHYCTFAHVPRPNESAYLGPAEVLAIAQRGKEAGCREALFTLGDRPELRYRVAAEELASRGHATTLSYLEAMASLVFRETGLLPHLNPGVMSAEDVARLREVSVSQGLMLESASERLCRAGGPHHGSPDKAPAARLATIAAAGAARVPFTSGILIGIGETRAERIEALLALRELHERYGHLQEIIVQNFRAKAGTRMAGTAEPRTEELLWTVAVTRILFGPEMNVQAPPNLNEDTLEQLIAAGINDWGGVSPVTPDHVNPEAPWPQIERLERRTRSAGKQLVERLAVYPAYARNAEAWIAPPLQPAVLRAVDASGFPRTDAWIAGALEAVPSLPAGGRSRLMAATLAKATRGRELSEDEIVELFGARGEQLAAVTRAADELRAHVCGERVTYVVTRNINYTNVCTFRCKFCAFSKGKVNANLRGRSYNLDLTEIVRRVREAWDRGAVEVCLQGGIHPEYYGNTYLAICRAIKEAVPQIHIHAFSPLEIWQGAATLAIPVREFLTELRSAGLGSLPGTAAEILDDPVRAIICPDKLTTAQWLEVVGTAHEVGLRTTATIMFGHVDAPRNWARHLLRLRRLQARTGGLTELVPLPFVPMETPLYRDGRCRLGPTYREAVLMHAVSRLVLHPLVTNVQTSWVKMGPQGALACLQAGANDLGGTLMNESITRAAGALHGQEMAPERMESLIRSVERIAVQRTTLYGEPSAARSAASFGALPLC